MKNMIKNTLFARRVSLDNIIHNDLYYYKKEGYGGKKIGKWPFYVFFYEYHHGKKQKATDAFISWYIDQFAKYYDKPKKLGGMYRGSLYMLIENSYKRHGLNFNLNNIGDDIHCQVFRESVAERVKDRFEMFDNIARYGYLPEKGSDIYAMKAGNNICLKGGHHRCAALKVLGYKDIPGVIVYPNKHFNLLLSKLKKG